MEEWYASYLRQIQQFTLLDDDQLAELLPKAKQGDLAAYRTLSDSCLEGVARIAESIAPTSKMTLHELVETGNAALQGAIESAPDLHPADFHDHVGRVVAQALGREA